jgi:ketol-acid reductoisomerase
MTKIYHENDADLSVLDGKIVGMIGYGNQGRSQALNMRDNGLKVIVGNREDDYRTRAMNDGFNTYNISETAQQADILFLLIPDEIQKEIYEKKIAPFMKKECTLVFAHGYNIAYNLIRPPKTVDILLIAPRMIGIGVRETYLSSEGYFTFLGIHQNTSGFAHQKLLALAKAVGGLSKAGIETSFEEETFLDLFTEQGFGGASSQVFMNPINILLENGYPPEAVLIELVLSGRMKYAFDEILESGLTYQLDNYPKKSQYGILSRGVRYREIFTEISDVQKEILKEIENGSFAKEWEGLISKVKLKVIKFFAPKVSIGRIEKTIRKNLKMPEVELFAEVPYPTDGDIKQKKVLLEELREFKDFSEY